MPESMFPLLTWLGLGAILMIAEVITGKLPLVLAGVASFLAAAVTMTGLDVYGQLTVAGSVFIAEYFILHQLIPEDEAEYEQAPVFVTEVRENGFVGIKYKGASWTGRLMTDKSDPLKPLYVHSIENGIVNLDNSAPFNTAP